MIIFPKMARELEALRGPSRALDRDLAQMVGRSRWLAQHYTQSFEAALTLLPRVTYVEISGSTDNIQPGVWPAVSLRWLPPGETDEKLWHGTVMGAPTFALAMCKAAVEVHGRLNEYIQ